MKHTLTIEPAIPPAERHKIEDILKDLGYDIHGGGTCTDMSSCDKESQVRRRAGRLNRYVVRGKL